MAKKTLEQLQYENAKIENEVNNGCAIVSLGFIGLIVVVVLMFLWA